MTYKPLIEVSSSDVMKVMFVFLPNIVVRAQHRCCSCESECDVSLLKRNLSSLRISCGDKLMSPQPMF